MKNNYVSFDGKNLSFFANDIKITNGAIPSEFEIKGEYRIGSESLAKLTAAIGSGAVIHTVKKCYCFAYSSRITIDEDVYTAYTHGAIAIKMAEDNRNIALENKRLTEENERLVNLIKQHNKSTIFSKIRIQTKPITIR